MKIKLLLDEDVHSGLALALRKRGYDVVHAQELDRIYFFVKLGRS